MHKCGEERRRLAAEWAEFYAQQKLSAHMLTAPPPTALRASILEMRKDHEEQLQRMKLLKDREIDAVTSATSHTRYVQHPGPAHPRGRPMARGQADPVPAPTQIPERHHRADGEVLQQPARAVLPRGGLAPHHHPGTGARAPAT